MYKSIWQFTRPSVDTPWPTGNADFNDLRTQATGFVGKEALTSEDNLTKTITGQWETEQDAINFKTANATAVAEVYASLTAYCEANGITLTETSETV